MTETAARPDERATRQPEQVTVDIAGAGAALGPPAAPERSHGYLVRGLGHLPTSRLAEGRFGRMFRRVPPFVPTDERIAKIAETMAEATPPDPEGDNPAIPAGFTYLGQFIDHDLTFDPVSSLSRQNDPDALVNFRTPRFDLDSLYGSGPADQPYLYEDPRAGRLLVEEHDGVRDLPRNRRGTALIGDPRNDENVIVSQLHLTMLLFHNKVLAEVCDLPDHSRPGDDRFTAAQRIVRWHYQWVVVHDFLRRVVGDETLAGVLVREALLPGGEPVEQVRQHFFDWDQQVFMPVEFSVAAYRFGHSIIRGRYRLNANVVKPLFTPRPASEDPLEHLGGFRPLPAGWQIEWRRLFDVDGRPADTPSRKIDTKLVPPLLEMPPEVAEGILNLAVRNLTRGARLGLPSGQDVARAMGVPVLTDEELGLPTPGPAPLWYYVLREAEKRAGGKHLGPVGGRIVAEVFLGILREDPSSYLSVAPGWKPFLPSAKAGDFTMADLLTYVDFGRGHVG
ncbi:heme peroxidase family protein [Actinomycetes bacterium KLBMP 9797]